MAQRGRCVVTVRVDRQNRERHVCHYADNGESWERYCPACQRERVERMADDSPPPPRERPLSDVEREHAAWLAERYATEAELVEACQATGATVSERVLGAYRGIRCAA